MKRYTPIVAFILLLAGCTKDLDLVPLDTISDGSFWKVTKDFENAANAFYPSLAGHANGLLDQDSDIAVGYSPNPISNGSWIVPQGDGSWNGSYQMVRATSRLIENQEIALDIQDETARYAAEARFFRARAYFNLVSRFGNVPLITGVIDIDSEELDAPRSPRSEVVNFILSDLDWAIENLPLESQISAGEKGRVSRGAALALKSRVALFEGTWAKYHSTGDPTPYLSSAIEAAENIISSNEYELYTADGPLESYYNLFLEAGEDSQESILARRFNQNLNVFHNTTRWVYSGINSPSKQLVDLYLCTDGLPIEISPLFEGYGQKDAEFQNRDPRFSNTVFMPGSSFHWIGSDLTINPPIGSSNENYSTGYMMRKYLSTNQTSQLGQSFYNFMEFRYAEVLLNLAEALYERDGSISDADLNRTVNRLRDRVGISHLTNALVSSHNLDMLEEIRRERTVELAFEGFRLNDLRRWKEAETHLPVDLLGVKYLGTEQESTPPNNALTPGVDIMLNAAGFLIADPGNLRQWSQRNYLFPVPLDQIQLNPNLEQNPGW